MNDRNSWLGMPTDWWAGLVAGGLFILGYGVAMLLGGR